MIRISRGKIITNVNSDEMTSLEHQTPAVDHEHSCAHTENIKHKRRKSSPNHSCSSAVDNHYASMALDENPEESVGEVSPRSWWRPSVFSASTWRRILPKQDSNVTSSTTSSSVPSSPFASDTSHSPCSRPLLKKTEVHLTSNCKIVSTVVSNDALENDMELIEVTAANVQILQVQGEGVVSLDDKVEVRETWDKKIDFLLSIVGFAVDLANVWRFPFLCYRNGGGAFLIPYFLMLIFGAVPLFYMELILGQFHRQGPISVWKICPLFKGAGYCAVLVAYFVSFYYNVIIGWAFYFMFASIAFELPWLNCNNTWNTPNCVDKSTNFTRLRVNSSGSFSYEFGSNRSSAAKEYFERSVLELHNSDGIHDLGTPKWQLSLCVLLVYVLLYLSLFKGVKSSGKVVWFTATMPYVVLSILLVRGLLLPGAVDGILYFIQPNMERLAHTQVWVDAAVQVFYSVGVGFGVHLTFASYNSFNNNCYRDCLITTAINSVTSLFSGLVIFTYLGYMSQLQQTDISKVATEGPGLVFEVYPEAISTLPGSNIWAFMFFLMLITLGMDSTMAGLESVITGFKDEFQYYFAKFRFSREIFAAIIMTISFLISNVNLTRGGGYMLHWFDSYSAAVSLLCSALFEAIGISWFYGLDRFCKDVQQMIGHKPSLYWRICWKFLSPFFLLSVIIFAIVNQQPLKYNDYIYPGWSHTLGWLFSLLSISAIPIAAIVVFYQQRGNNYKEKLAYSITPPDELNKISTTGQVSRFQVKHWLTC